MYVQFVRCIFGLALYSVLISASAIPTILSGSVKVFTDDLNAFSGESLVNQKYSISWTYPGPLPCASYSESFSNLQVGGFVFNVGQWGYLCLATETGLKIYLHPQQPISVNAGGISLSGFAAGTITLGENGFNSLGVAIWRSESQYTRLTFSGSSASTVTLPEPSSYTLMIFALGAVGFANRVRPRI